MTGHAIFGREAELAEVDTALDAVALGQPRALLIGGDAGIGKTTLAAAVAARAADRGFTVLTGQCLDIDSGVSFAAVREALRPHLPAGADAAVLDDIRLAVCELAAQRPVLLLLEDLHWADRSTQELTVALARSVTGPVLLVLTYRGDELTRRHPFRKAQLEIARGVGAHRIDLEPLGRAGMAELVHQVTGTDDPGRVGAVLARSEGNPLYAEELLAARDDGVPASLAGLLLSRVDALTDTTRRLLRIASVNGLRIDPGAVVAMSGASEDDVETALREALDANVLAHRGEHLEFRHGLLQEAVYDDVLPGERARLHAALAAAIQAETTDTADAVTLGRLAHHWYVAHEHAEALAASARAGIAARRFGAPEAAIHLDRVLELWDQVPAPASVAGVDRADVLCWLSQLHRGENKEERSLRLIRQAIDELRPDSDPLLVSRVHATYGEFCHELDDFLGHREAVRVALDAAEGAPSEELARALLATAWVHSDSGAVRTSIPLLERALDVARSLDGPTRAEAEILSFLGTMLVELGEVTAGLARLEEAARVAEGQGLRALALEADGDRAFHLMMSGRTAQGHDLAAAVREQALALGLAQQAAFAGEQLVDQWRDAGRFDDADLLLEQIKTEDYAEWRWRCMRAEQLMARGDLEPAAVLERETIALLEEVASSGDPWHCVRQVDLFAALGDPDTVLASLARFFGDTPDADSPLTLSLCARGGYAALTHARLAGRDVEAGLVDECVSRLARAVETMTDEGWRTLQGAELHLAIALARDLSGDPATGEWRTAEESARPFGAYHVLRARLGLAAALLAEGERDEGRSLVTEVWQSARTLGARWFEQEAGRIARRNRVTLPGDDEQVSGPLTALTPREREVLDVLASGATNREIAQRLFISEKTVSVHVTNVLAKLGVTNRGAAAALARQLSGA